MFSGGDADRFKDFTHIYCFIKYIGDFFNHLLQTADSPWSAQGSKTLFGKPLY